MYRTNRIEGERRSFAARDGNGGRDALADIDALERDAQIATVQIEPAREEQTVSKFRRSDNGALHFSARNIEVDSAADDVILVPALRRVALPQREG